MIEFNEDIIKKNENKLIYFKGFIPFQICDYIDMLRRNNYLKSIGLFEDIQKEIIEVRNAMKISGDADIYLEKVLKKWVADNPQFKDLVIFD